MNWYLKIVCKSRVLSMYTASGWAIKLCFEGLLLHARNHLSPFTSIGSSDLFCNYLVMVGQYTLNRSGSIRLLNAFIHECMGSSFVYNEAVDRTF